MTLNYLIVCDVNCYGLQKLPILSLLSLVYMLSNLFPFRGRLCNLLAHKSKLLHRAHQGRCIECPPNHHHHQTTGFRPFPKHGHTHTQTHDGPSSHAQRATTSHLHFIRKHTNPFVSSLPIPSYVCEYMHIDIYLHKWRRNKLSPQGRLPTTLSLTLIVLLAVWSEATRLPAVRIDVKHRDKLLSQG